MQAFNTYVFFLCLFVFAAFVITFTVMIAGLAKSYVRLIRLGAEDDAIQTEREKLQKKRKAKSASNVIGKVLFGLLAVALAILFVLSLVVQHCENNTGVQDWSIRVVKSGSMSYKNEFNKNLPKDVNDQFQMFELIMVEKLPPEMELELYDIVVYEQNGYQIVHRIVGIEEPNEKHPDQRLFLLQGDAVSQPDAFPVLYKQMKAIYTGTHIPNIGSFVMFMQSPAGWLCIILILFAMIATPLVEKKIENEKRARLAMIAGERLEPDFNLGSRRLADPSAPIVLTKNFLASQKKQEERSYWQDLLDGKAGDIQISATVKLIGKKQPSTEKKREDIGNDG